MTASIARRCCVGLVLLLFFSRSTGLAEGFTPLTLGKYQAHPTRLIAKFANGATLQSSRVTLDSLGVAVQRAYPLVPGLVTLDRVGGRGNSTKLRVSAVPVSASESLLEQIQALRDSGLFEYVQPSYVYTNLLAPNDTSFVNGMLWGLRNTGASGGTVGADIGAVQAWDITTGSSNVIVAVVDTGIRYSHRDLAAQLWHNPGEIPDNGIDDDHDGWVDDVYGINAVTGSGDPFDDNDHGTHVSGTIGAAANNGAPSVGVAWHVQIMALKFLGVDGFGLTDDAIACIQFAVHHGARVINASWAGGPYDLALLDALSAARRAGLLFVAAAGNDSANNDVDPVYPASYPLDNVISVAALDRFDQLASFSNFGAASVHLAAPGDEIYSCIAQSDTAYEVFSGTSMAAPHVSGVAALILSAFPNASIPELRARLLSTAVSIPSLSGKLATGGRVNAYRALTVQPDGILELGFDPVPESDLSARRPVAFSVTVTDLSGVTNAIVKARVGGDTSEVVLHNDGADPDFKALDEVYSGYLTLPTTPGNFPVVFSVSAPGKTGVTQTVEYNIASPPLNDNFADAFDLPPDGAAFFWTNRFASIEQGEPLHAQVPSVANSVWWNWTPSRNSSVIVDTTGSSFDTVLAVYTNSVLAQLKAVAAADDSGNQKQAYVIFDALGGVTYHIAVAGFSSAAAGTIRLRVDPGGGPDATAPQVVIGDPATGLVVTNATDARLTVSGSATDPQPNATGIKLVQVQINRDVATTALGTTNWSSTVLLREGQNRIKVAAFDVAGNASPTRSITVSYQPNISPNDAWTNAIELTGLAGTVSGDNSRATKEPGEPDHAGNPGGKSIWWFYRPSLDGLLSLTTTNSSFRTLLAVYQPVGSGLASWQTLGSSDAAFPGAGFSQLTQPIRAGNSYYVAVDGYDGSTGAVQLAYNFTPATVRTLTVAASDGGSVFPGTSYFANGARVSLTATPSQFYWFDRWLGSVPSTENPLPLLLSSDLQLSAQFLPVDFSDGFESGGLNHLPWKGSGSLPWAVQTNQVKTGRFAARSGAIGNGQKSSLILTSVFRAGTGSFWVRVSSEQTWDVLDFYLNGKALNRWSGEVDWSVYLFSLAAGTNTLEWRYSKDFLDTKAGLDAVFIDNLELPLLVPADATTPARLTLERFADGALQAAAAGQTNQLYVIQQSPDLKHWEPMSTNVAAAGFFRWQPAGGQNSNQFYRVLSP